MAKKMPYYMFQDLERGRTGIPDELIAPLLAAELDKINQYTPTGRGFEPYPGMQPSAGLQDRRSEQYGTMPANVAQFERNQANPTTPTLIALDEFLGRPLSEAAGVSDIKLPPGEVLTSFSKSLDEGNPMHPMIQYPNRPLREMVNEQRGSPSMYLQDVNVHPPFPGQDVGAEKRALLQEGDRRLNTGEVMVPPGHSPTELTPVPANIKDTLKDMMDKMPGGSPPPLDPKDFPGLEDFLSPGTE